MLRVGRGGFQTLPYVMMILFCLAMQADWAWYRGDDLEFRYPPEWELIQREGQVILQGQIIITPAPYEELGFGASATPEEALNLFLDLFTTGEDLAPLNVPDWDALDIQVRGDHERTLAVLKTESGDFVFIAATTANLSDLIPLVLSIEYHPPRNPLIPLYLEVCALIRCF